MGITREGIQGEQKLFEWLRENGFSFFQADAIAYKDGEWYVFETKHQEHFKSPPYDGHGLPPYQVKSRLEFQDETGIIAYLVVFEKGNEKIYHQRLDKLEEGEHFNTKTNPRRIYKLSNFELENKKPPRNY